MMSKRNPISLDVKLRVVKRCLQNEISPKYEAKQLGIDKSTVTEWVRKFKADGYEGLKKSRGCKAYSEELKLAAITDVLSGNHSIREVTKRYVESFYLTKHDTYGDVFQDVRNYIRYYNNYRYTERLNGLSPNEYRKQAA